MVCYIALLQCPMHSAGNLHIPKFLLRFLAHFLMFSLSLENALSLMHCYIIWTYLPQHAGVSVGREGAFAHFPPPSWPSKDSSPKSRLSCLQPFCSCFRCSVSHLQQQSDLASTEALAEVVTSLEEELQTLLQLISQLNRT